MRDKVVQFFQNLPENKSDQFNQAFELYRETPTKSHSAERVYNASGYSETSLNNLMYDLQKLHEISDVEKLPIDTIKDNPDFRIEILEKVSELTLEYFPLWLDGLKDSGLDLNELSEFAVLQNNEKAITVLNEIKVFREKLDVINLIADANIEELKKDFELTTPTIEHLQETLQFAKSVNNQIAVEKIQALIEILNVPVHTGAKKDDLQSENEELKDQNEDLYTENEDLKDENEELKNELESSKSLPKISAESLRVEFPFLNDKDCPNELKILVADKITAWNIYLENQSDLAKIEAGELIVSDEVKNGLAKSAVDSFAENQKIYDELNAYKETGKVLGKHPFFRTLQLTREVEGMTMDEKIKYKGSTSKFFSTNKKDLATAEKAKDVDRIELLTDKIAERTEKLELVNKSLGVK